MSSREETSKENNELWLHSNFVWHQHLLFSFNESLIKVRDHPVEAIELGKGVTY